MRVEVMGGGGVGGRQKLQQLTSHGSSISPEERLACQHPHLTRGQRGGGLMWEEEESCPTAALINMHTCSLWRYPDQQMLAPAQKLPLLIEQIAQI